MTHQIVAVIGAHANWAGPIMFVLSFGESFAFLGLLFPGTAIMVAAGAFIPGGTLSFWPLVIGCLTGAIAGDAISFWLGRRYGHLIGRVWPFSGRPELLARGFAFFERHGGKSVFLGRFFGPLRALIPLVAGIAKMPAGRFWVANVSSALIWAPALLLPGALTVWASRSLQTEEEWEWASIAAIAAAIGIAVWAVKKYHLFDRI